MKKFMKRLAGVALTLAMMVTMLPAQSAYAAREVEKQETEEQIVWEHFDEEYYSVMITNDQVLMPFQLTQIPICSFFHSDKQNLQKYKHYHPYQPWNSKDL